MDFVTKNNKKKVYESEYHNVFHKNLLSNKDYYLFRAKCSDYFYWRLFKNKYKGKFLEFGCGVGQNIFLHKENSVGIDISDFCIKECKKRGINALKDIEKLGSNKFDGVISKDVLEHLDNPLYYIRQVHRVLKKGGIFVLILPVEDKNIPIKTARDIGKISPTHLHSWVFETINQLLIYAGFRIRLNRFNYYSGYSIVYRLPFPSAIFLLRLAGRLRNKKEMIIVAEK